MDIDSILKIITFFIFLFFSAFFSSAETAFTAFNRLKLRGFVDRKLHGAKILEKILNQPKKLITAILIGNNVANVGASVMATASLTDFLKYCGINSYATSMAIVTGLMTFIILTLGEITPKTIAIKNAEKFALLIAKPIYFILILFHPLVIVFTHISKGISKIFGISSGEVGRILTAEDIKNIVKLGKEEGVLEKEEQEMIRGIFEFSETIVREIMTPRTDAACIDINEHAISDVIHLIMDTGHSRIPVYENEIDNIIGFVYAKDLLGVSDTTQSFRSFIRAAVFIPETNTIEDSFHQLKKAKIHLAIVVDEYGGMSGLVTMEDIIEEIVGEIQDEYDVNEEPEFITLSENRFLVDASMNIQDLEAKIDVKFPQEEDYDTVAGFILCLLDKFPKKGEVIQYKTLTFTVKNIKKQRILKVEIVETPA